MANYACLNSLYSFLPMLTFLSFEQNAAILELLSHCGQQARQAAADSDSFEVFEKGFQDYVTTVDQALDQYLSKGFTAQFPDDGIITEENQASAAEFLTQHRRLWCIDPIDGTEDFIKRGQHYAVMIGLLSAFQPQAGWIHAPAQNQTYWGGAGWGLFQQSGSAAAIPLEPVTPDIKSLPVMLMGKRDQRRFGPAIASRLPEVQFDSLGSFGLKVLTVITGQAGIYVYLNGRVKLWDTVGPLALAKAAGLTCCDLDAQPIRFDVNSIYPQSLMHRQPIVVGWPQYVRAYLPAVRQGMLAVRGQELGIC